MDASFLLFQFDILFLKMILNSHIVTGTLPHHKNLYMYKMGFFPRKKLYKLDYFEEFLCKVNFLICISMAMRGTSISHTLLQLHCSFPALSTFAIQIFLFMLVKYWKKCKTSKLPLIGNLHQLNGGPLPHHRTTELSKKYGPAMQLKLVKSLRSLYHHLKQQKRFLKTKEPNFAQRHAVLAVELVSYDDATSLEFSVID